MAEFVRQGPIVATAAVDPASREQWPEDSLGALLPRAAERAPGRLALVDGDRCFTYRELGDRVARLIGALERRGVGEGAVVLAQLPNGWELQVLAHAVWGLGAVLVPVTSIYREHEVRAIVEEADPDVIVVQHRHRSFDFVEMMCALRRSHGCGSRACVVVTRVEGPLPDGFLAWDQLAGDPRPHLECAPERIALLLYTSGTTGTPKGVLHTHGALLYEVDSIVELARLGDEDRVFMPSPLTHITGVLYGTILPVRLGIPCVLTDRWEPRIAMATVEEERLTFTVAASPFLHGLCRQYEGTGGESSLRVFICGGADVPPDLVRRSRAALGARVVRAYGLSEMPTYCCGDPFGDERVAAETDGLPIGPVEGKLLDEREGVGELAIRGPELFAGYLNPAANAGAFTADGFFRSGDLASIEPSSGAITIRGRIKDLIIRGGENLSAREIENVLFEHPAVEDVAVVGAPDPVLGERPFAFVVPVSGSSFSIADAQEHLGRHGLAKQKWPEGLELLDQLPQTASGKVKKFELRERLRRALK